MTADDIISRLGGVTAVAKLCGLCPAAVKRWRIHGIPSWHWRTILSAPAAQARPEVRAVPAVTLEVLQHHNAPRRRLPLTAEMEAALHKAIAAAGGASQLGRRIGVIRQTVSLWRRCPADKVLAVEHATGVPRQELRPDLHPPAWGAK